MERKSLKHRKRKHKPSCVWRERSKGGEARSQCSPTSVRPRWWCGELQKNHHRDEEHARNKTIGALVLGLEPQSSHLCSVSLCLPGAAAAKQRQLCGVLSLGKGLQMSPAPRPAHSNSPWLQCGPGETWKFLELLGKAERC